MSGRVRIGSTQSGRVRRAVARQRIEPVHRWSRGLLAALGTLALLGGTALAAPAASAAGPGRYVALGDSYSSGVGAGPYDPASGRCDRSAAAYPALWAAAHHPSSFAFVACSGAATADVASDQLSALTGATDLVSISVGGNDAGFTSVMTTCVLLGQSSCLDRVATAVSFVHATLPARLDALFGKIRASAPDAAVVVLGYPRLYHLGGSCLVGLSETERTAINQAADALDGVLSARAAAAGFAFGDVRPAFAGHEICGSETQWLHSVSLLSIGQSYHPNAAGQAGGYLPVLSAQAAGVGAGRPAA